MKRSGPPQRKTRLRSSAPLRSRTPLARTGRPGTPRTPLKAVSAKRAALLAARQNVRRVVLERDGGCVPRRRGLPGLCWHPPDATSLDVHEIINRSQWSESWLHPEWCIATCRRHHEVITSATGDLRTLCHHLGLHRDSWERDNGPPTGVGW